MGLFSIFQKKGNLPEQEKKDYSLIDTSEKAKQSFNNKELVKLYLMPLEFGGLDNPLNTLFVPEFANNHKIKFDARIDHLLADGKDLRYSAKPEYRGNSFVPSKIIITISGDESFVEIIEIW